MGVVAEMFPRVGAERLRNWEKKGVIRVARISRSAVLVNVADVRQALDDIARNGVPRERYVTKAVTTARRRAAR